MVFFWKYLFTKNITSNYTVFFPTNMQNYTLVGIQISCQFSFPELFCASQFVFYGLNVSRWIHFVKVKRMKKTLYTNPSQALALCGCEQFQHDSAVVKRRFYCCRQKNCCVDRLWRSSMANCTERPIYWMES